MPGYAAVADRILFDARAPKDATRPGGLGAVFDWHLLENLDLELPFMVSGGLNAGNVAEAVRVTRAGGVDVSSGVERAPGVKDPEMIRAFIRAARATEDDASSRDCRWSMMAIQLGSSSRHARTCPGHPRLLKFEASKTWMAGVKPGHDERRQ